MTEKLLTLEETAHTLNISEDAVRRLVEKEEIPAYQIGGVYLRFKEEQVLLLKQKFSRQTQSLQNNNLQNSPVTHDDSLMSRFTDFLYFNDFYISSALIVACLFYVIYKAIM